MPRQSRPSSELSPPSLLPQLPSSPELSEFAVQSALASVSCSLLSLQLPMVRLIAVVGVHHVAQVEEIVIQIWSY